MEPEMSEHSSSTLHAHEVEPLTCPEALEELFADHLADEAAIFASEVCSPNSHEWSEVRRSREECTVFQAAALRHFLQRWLPAPVAADGLDWPLSASPSVVHVGYFDSSLKGATHNSTSLEGNGLSVSSCPDAWRQIARLGDAPAWVMQRHGSKFLDVHALTQSHREAVARWAIANCFAAQTPAARVSYDDPESGTRVSFLFDSADPAGDALARAEFEEQDEGSQPLFERVHVLGSSDLMIARVGFKVPLGLVEDMALTLFVEDVLHPLHAVDGVWWKDELAPELFSAPRGVIHPTALDAWTRVQLRAPDRLRPRAN